MPRDPRQLPFLTRIWPKLAIAAIIAAPVMWVMNMHLDYSSERHGPGEDNPISYVAYGLEHAQKDMTSAYRKTSRASDVITATVEGRPVPPENPPPATPPERPAWAARQPTQVMVCVPQSLVPLWDNPESDQKMLQYKDLMAIFIQANGRPNQEYFVGNYDSYQPGVTDPQELVSSGPAQQGCPVNFKPYMLPLPNAK